MLFKGEYRLGWEFLSDLGQDMEYNLSQLKNGLVTRDIHAEVFRIPKASGYNQNISGKVYCYQILGLLIAFKNICLNQFTKSIEMVTVTYEYTPSFFQSMLF